MHISLAHGRWKHALGDDETGAGALGIVGGRQVVRRAIVVGTRSGHRRHDESIRRNVATDGDWREQLPHDECLGREGRGRTPWSDVLPIWPLSQGVAATSNEI